MKIGKSLKKSGLLMEEVGKKFKMKERTKWGFLGMLLGTLGASLLGNLLLDKGIIRSGQGF